MSDRAFGCGNIADPNQAVVTIDNQPFDVVRPADLVMDETLSCGEAVTLTAEVSEDGSVNFMLEATVEGSDLAHTDFDLFGAIRQVIDDEGFAGRQSNVRFLSGN
jgi:fibronectin type 3 domain-containing protein